MAKTVSGRRSGGAPKVSADPSVESQSKGVPPLYAEFGETLSVLPDLAREIRALQAQRDELDTKIREYNSAVLELMRHVKSDESWSVRVDDDVVVSYVQPGPSKTIVPELLVQQGVSLEQIKRATRITPRSPYVSVRSARKLL